MPLDVLIITDSRLKDDSVRALHSERDDYCLASGVINCDDLRSGRSGTVADGIIKKIRQLRSTNAISDQTRIVINLPGAIVNGKLLSDKRNADTLIDIVDLCEKIRHSTGKQPWRGTLHLACNSAGSAREEFRTHDGATIIHAGTKKFSLTQRHQTLSLLAEAWNREKLDSGDAPLNAADEFRLVARFSGENSAIVRDSRIMKYKAVPEWSENQKLNRRTVDLLARRADGQRSLETVFARNYALARLRHGSTEKFVAALTNNSFLIADPLFREKAREYMLDLHVDRDFGGKLIALTSRGIIRETKGYKEDLLIKAFEKGKEDVVKALMFLHAKINCRAPSGRTPLHIAAARGDEKLVRLALVYGADPKKTDKGLSGKTAADLAREAGAVHVARLIETELGQSRLNKQGLSAESIDLLFGDEDEMDIRKYLQEPEHHLVRLEKYIAHGERYLRQPERYLKGSEKLARRRALALKFAAITGHQRMMKILLDPAIGVPVDQKISGGKTALQYAARAGDVAMVKLLLEHEADPQLRSKAGSTALDYGIRSGSRQVVEQLLAHGARITKQHWFSRQTVERLGRKGWLDDGELREQVIRQLHVHHGKYHDNRVIAVLADCLPKDAKLTRQESTWVQAMIGGQRKSASTRKLSGMLTLSGADDPAKIRSKQASDH